MATVRVIPPFLVPAAILEDAIVTRNATAPNNS